MITAETAKLRSLIEPLIVDKDEASKSRRATVRNTFTAMAQLVDTALIRTPGLVDTLARRPSKLSLKLDSVEEFLSPSHASFVWSDLVPAEACHPIFQFKSPEFKLAQITSQMSHYTSISSHGVR